MKAFLGIAASLVLLACAYTVPAFADYTVPPKTEPKMPEHAKANMQYKLSMKNKSLSITAKFGIQGPNGTKQSPSPEDYKRAIQDANDGRSIKITKIATTTDQHTVTVQVCAGKNNLYNPEISIRSDTQSSDVKIWGLVKPSACKVNDFSVQSKNKSSIRVTFSGR